MEVMINHKWRDSDIAGVSTSIGEPDVREVEVYNIGFDLLISKNDVVALCDEFGMVAYDKSSQLTAV